MDRHTSPSTRTPAPISVSPPKKKPGMLAGLRKDISAAGLEFVGTVIFLLIGLGGIQATAEANQSSAPQSKVLTNIFISAVRSYLS